jgi:ribosomal protein S18 acetylase RimI-like enzyme
VDDRAVEVLRRVESWTEEASDPLLSEYTRNAIEASTADVFTADRVEAVVTLVATANRGTGLVEVAGEIPEAAADLWPQVVDEVYQRAAARGLSRLEIIDRGSALRIIEGTTGRAVVRLVSAGPFVVTASTSRAYTPADAVGLLEVINEAFQDHPENGKWTISDLESRTLGTRFDPACLLVRHDTGQISGFCWTKVHPDGVGEVYLFAVAPGWRGSGLAKELLQEGISHLAGGHGCPRIIVYTESGNRAAMDLYTSAGLDVDRIDRRIEVDLSV